MPDQFDYMSGGGLPLFQGGLSPEDSLAYALAAMQRQRPASRGPVPPPPSTGFAANGGGLPLFQGGNAAEDSAVYARMAQALQQQSALEQSVGQGHQLPRHAKLAPFVPTPTSPMSTMQRVQALMGGGAPAPSGLPQQYPLSYPSPPMAAPMAPQSQPSPQRAAVSGGRGIAPASVATGLPAPGNPDGINADLLALYNEAAQGHLTAQAQADKMWQEYLAEQQKPVGLTPGQSFMGDFFGNMSQAIAPQMQGLAQTDQTKQRVNMTLEERQRKTLESLHDHYAEAAQKAQAMGDTEKAIKMRSAELKIQEKLTLAERAFTAKENAATRGVQMYAADSATRAAGVRATQDAAELAAKTQREAGHGLYAAKDLAAGMTKLFVDGKKAKLNNSVVANSARSYWALRASDEPLDGRGLAQYIQRQAHGPSPETTGALWWKKAAALNTPEQVFSNAVAIFGDNKPPTAAGVAMLRQAMMAAYGDRGANIVDEWWKVNGGGQ